MIDLVRPFFVIRTHSHSGAILAGRFCEKDGNYFHQGQASQNIRSNDTEYIESDV